MSKRLTSLLVGALAVVLLGAPVQAQTDARRATGNRQLVNRVIKPGQYAEQHQAALAKQQKEMEAQAQQVTVQASTAQQGGSANQAMRAEFAIPTMRFGAFERTLPARTPLMQVTETVDEHGIILAPAEGETKYYTRGGDSYYYSNGQWGATYQNGHVQIVECADGTVYIHDILCRGTFDSWVKGTKDGNTITVAYGQPMAYSAQYSATIDLKWAMWSGSTFAAVNNKTDNFVFVIDGNTLSLQGTAFPSTENLAAGDCYQIAAVWSDDNSLQALDSETVYTLDAEYTPAPTVLVELPAGVQTEVWYSLIDGKNGNVTVGFNDNDVYVQGLISDYPESWIKGTIDGNNVVFAKNQFVGTYSAYNIFATSADEDDNLVDFVMAYDAEAKAMVGKDLIANAADDKLYYLAWYEDVAIQAEEFGEPVIATGDPVQVPYENSLNTEEEQAQLGILDANGDKKTWTFNEDGVAQYSYSSTEAADDYLVTPAVYLEEGKNYRFAFDAAPALSSYPERVEVLMGTEAKVSAFQTVVIEPTDVNWSGYKPVQNEELSVSESGYYFFAIHAISDADMYRLYVDNIVVEIGIEPTSPAAPIITSVVADPYGLNKATITVIAPSTNIAGEPLTENIGAIAILRNGQEVKRFENVRPEDTKVFVDFVDKAGEAEYQAVPYTAEGKRGTKSEAVSAFVGLDVPYVVENVNAVEQEDGSVTLTWDPVTTGLNGGPVVTDNIVYFVCTGEIGYIWGIIPYVILTGIEDITTGLTSNVELDNDAEQAAQQLFILAYNGEMDIDAISDYLEEYADYAAQAMFFAGAPYELPFIEHFNEGLDNAYLVNYSDYAAVKYSEDNSDDEGCSLLMASEDAGEFALYETGKITLTGAANPTLAFDVKSSAAQNKMRVQVLTPDGKSTLLRVVTMDEEFKTVKLSLADFASHPFVKLMFTTEFAAESEVCLDNVMVLDLLEYNLSAAISAPESVKAGESAEVTVTVKNFGANAAENFTVKVFANDDQLFSEKVTEPLASFGKQVFTVEYPTTIFDEAGEVTLSAEVIYNIDLDDEDNTAETVINVKQSTAAAPENVVAQKTGEGVKLSWTAPSSTSEEVTEDFEAELSEDWTIIDLDGDGYSWTQLMNERMSTHSGIGCIVSQSYINNVGALTPDNWLISPLAVLSGTFSFWACGQDADYCAEHFQVYVSTDGNNFEAVSDEFVATGEMTQYSVDLSSYNGVDGYIAIRHFNVTDMYYLNVDDITYTMSSGSVVAYNVYKNGELYETTTETSIEIKGASADDVFAVSAVYSNGKESRPVVVTVGAASQEITAIEQIARNGQAVDIYSIDGRMVRQQATSLEGLRGAYIIEGRKVVVK